MNYLDLEYDELDSHNPSLYIGYSVNNTLRPGKLFVISGPSGVGKTTLANAMLDKLGESCGLERVVTYTTRAPRGQEVPEIDYHYITVADFQQKLAVGFFMEYSRVYDHYYGSPRYVLDELKSGDSYLLVIDLVGAAKIKVAYPRAVLIWIAPPSLEDLRTRLVGRRVDSTQEIDRRLQIAAQELNQVAQVGFDYELINSDLNTAKRDLELVFRAELAGDCRNS